MNTPHAGPRWLLHALAALDRAVWNAYDGDDPNPVTADEETVLSRLSTLNLERRSQEGALR